MHPLVARRRVCLERLASLRGKRRPALPAVVIAGLLASTSGAQPTDSSPRSDFLSATQLAPFVVKGERLSISILARTNADRRYAEKFAEDVMEVVYATVENSAGAGLVIVGEEGEPHPVFVFRKFVELAEAGQLDPGIAARAKEASGLMHAWQQRLQLDQAAKDGLPLESFLKALPLPLEGVASKLYQFAWEERFDEKRVEQKLRSLTAADLAADRLSRFDWVFYLPPREAAGNAINEIVPAMLKKEKVGFFKRTAIRSAMVVFAPAIRKGVEAARKGMLFTTVLHARSGYSDEDIRELTRVYVRVLMPGFKFNDSTTRERAIAAVEAQKLANAEHARDPFVSPGRLADFDAAAYAKFEGAYAEKQEPTHRFARSADGFTWQYRDQKPRPFFPAGDRLFVAENGKSTVEFLVDDAGIVTGAQLRWHRGRRTLRRTSAGPHDGRRPASAAPAM